MAYMWNLKDKDVNELIYRTERDPQKYKTNLWLPKGRGGINLRVWDQRIPLLHIK